MPANLPLEGEMSGRTEGGVRRGAILTTSSCTTITVIPEATGYPGPIGRRSKSTARSSLKRPSAPAAPSAETGRASQ